MSETPYEPRRAPKKGRSPSYPAIDLEAAIRRAEALYAQEKMHPAPIGAIVGHWGYKTHKSGVASTQYAALKKFGLLDEEGSGDNRQGRLTDLAFAILHNPDEDERLAAIQQAALTPPIHRELWAQYGLELPSEKTLRYRLVTERGFTDAGADDFVKQYKQTIEFAMPEGALIGEEPDYGQSGDDELPTPSPLVRSAWESQPVQVQPRPPSVNVWHSDSGERITVQAPEPPASPRTTRHAIPLIGGKQVVLEGEFPLTESAWQGFMAVLQAFKPGLVETAPEPTASESEDRTHSVHPHSSGQYWETHNHGGQDDHSLR